MTYFVRILPWLLQHIMVTEMWSSTFLDRVLTSMQGKNLTIKKFLEGGGKWWHVVSAHSQEVEKKSLTLLKGGAKII